MRHPVLLVTTLCAIVLMSDVHVALAADVTMWTASWQKPPQERAGQSTHPSGGFPSAVRVDVDAQLDGSTGLLSWRRTEGSAPFRLLPDFPAAEGEEGVEDLLLVQDEHGVADDENTVPRALGRDWRGLGRDTVFFLGYQLVAAGVWFLTPESVSKWTPDQRKTSLQQWWENVQHPQWDPDNWYVNYLGHPYFGAISYTRARERGFGAFGSFWYAALLSGLYEFGIEAMFERPSYQDLIVTPVGGLLLGALLFEPIREHIQSKPELQWYDHVTLTLTDPMGAANSVLEGLLGIQADVRVQFHLPALAPHAQFNEPSVRSLNRPQEHLYRSPGVGIEFSFFQGRKRSARRTR
jgi:hypothetical protein